MKNDNPHAETAVLSNPVLHLGWIVFILVLVIAALIVRSPDGNVMYNYVSFASGVSSIVLAVVAIVYSMISNRGIDASLGEIRGAALKIADETSRLNVASQGLSKEADDALRRLSDMPNKLDQISGELGTKIDNLSLSETFEGETPQSENETSDTVEAGGKPVGMVLALYILAKSYELTKQFNSSKIFPDESERPLRNYINGAVDVFKHFKTNGIDVDGISGVYIVRSLGNMSLSGLVQNVESNSNGQLEQWREQVKKYFEPESVEGDNSSDEEVK